ncbi:hypothetical protein K440DRAFT_657395 [Wilcoxina mikolae CBS 423.85]|nr:hypothetical protein K440DRAFT_657395 [Wilcoxina mikolae CBS 423.85]
MQFIPLLFLLFLTVTSLPEPLPTSTKKKPKSIAIQPHSNNIALEAHTLATKLGIDPAGPHPSDYEKYNGKYFTFKKGSKFATWVAAQGARLDADVVSGNSEIGIAIWKDSDCTGDGMYTPDSGYDIFWYNPDVYDLSMQTMGYVDPGMNRVWMYTWDGKGDSPSDYCGIDKYWYVYGGPGCANVPPFSCFVMQLTSVRND